MCGRGGGGGAGWSGVRSGRGRLGVDAVPGRPQEPRGDPLTVLRQLARGRRNRHIAEVPHISEFTVKFHVTNILDRLGVGSRGAGAA